MRWAHDLGLARRTLTRARWRALAMMAGIAVGIGSLTILASVGESTRAATMRQFRNMLGTSDTIIVRPGGAATRGMVSLANVPPTLSFDDARAIARLATVADVAELQNAFDIDVTYRGRTDSPAIFGVSPNWLPLRGDTLAQGRFFTAAEDGERARVAVLGADVIPLLFPGENPLGKTLRIGTVPFTVVGVLTARGAGPGGASLDHLILIPVTSASTRLFNRDFLTMVIAQVRNQEDPAPAMANIRSLLRQRHHIAAAALDDFTLTSPAAMMARVEGLGSTLERLLRALAWAATAIGTIVIFSLMWLGVSERRRDIGVRRAAGAARGDILVEFLAEAMAVSCAGGVMGASLGLGMLLAAQRLAGMPIALSASALGPAVGVAIATGLLAGILPAWRAARLDPVQALRS